MPNNFFYKNKFINKKNDKYKLFQDDKKTKKKVDINILLNRVKLVENNEKKKTIIFISTTIISLFLFSYILIF